MAGPVYMARSVWTALLDSIRAKGGTSAPMTAAQAKAAVEAIETGDGGTSVNDVLSDMAKKQLTGDIVLDASVTAAPNSYFMSGQGITSFRADGLKSLNSYTFLNCSLLKTIKLPALENLYAVQCFSGCTSLEMACFPKLGTGNTGYFYSATFMGCSKLEVVDLNVLGTNTLGIGSNDFRDCASLNTLILRKSDAICPLGNVNCFQGSPFASGGSGGTVYVPQALISTYQSATNWSTLYSAGTVTFAPIEGSIYETQYADGTPVT